MAPKRTPEAVVDEFLKSASARTIQGGAPCKTCALKNRKAVDRAALHFNQQRSSGETTVGWGAFVKHVLSKEPFNYPLGWRALVNHLERHCDADIS